MTLAAWPASLPRPERDTFSMVPAEARLKRRAETGAPSYRLRFSGVPKYVSMSVLLTRSQRATFDEFFEVTTRWGSLPFTMADPTTEGWPMTDGNGNPVVDALGRPILMSGTWLCLFGDTPPSETVTGIRFRKSFRITVMP